MTGLQNNGVVAAGHQLTAGVAADMLRTGGSAIDAAIAGLAMACVCEPVLCSPGGGGFAMVRDGATGAICLIDFFPQTPLERRHKGEHGVREILADFGTATQAFHIGPATSATPGFFPGLEMLHTKGARFSMVDLVAPAARAARDGVLISPFQHFLNSVVQSILTATPAAAALFAPDGGVLNAGARFHNYGLAEALEACAADGFAASAVAQAALQKQAKDGHLTKADLGAYQAVERVPVVLDVAGHKVHMNPAPAASGTLIAHSLSQLERADPEGIARALLATSAARTAAGGDLSKLEDILLRQRGTTHISVIDDSGTACAVTVSNGEGNGELVGDFGFMLNNILGEEDVNPHSTANWPVNTRLSSMMCPTMIEGPAGDLVALGSGGSNRIRSAIFQVVAQLCFLNADLEQAVAAPRLHVEGNHLDFEDLFGADVASALRQLCADHRAWPEPNMFFGGVHAARLHGDGSFSGKGDSRRDGTAIVVS